MERHTLHTQLDTLTSTVRPTGIELATLTPFDIPVLAALTLEAYDETVNAESMLEVSEELRLTFEGAFGETTEDSCVGAWDGGTLVGAILVVLSSPWEDSTSGPFVADLIVAPEYRRRGIATSLISEVAHRCRSWGYETLTLRIDSHRHLGAYELYDMLGFETVEK